ncbi:hypothetical protein EAY27_21365 [Vibrio anguillarum]|uniref:Uncharacterized protein n=3 Tax=Vibrio anguillarum TaxID=55601 RepID=A0ABD4KWG8_VIBAN|nr:hypothetical protein CK207_10550 [Vibrio anguillarum]MBF4274819.1 hypothetical protein [Vibrio anguillarum]MBF4279637.1 hypothetical protein [Vibrio anguillarum]MBF4291064.1 hypothetical protein [Vibrio anguillarum]MBF4323262.1 hypothetical protein [Vibrio anguillarum]
MIKQQQCLLQVTRENDLNDLVVSYDSSNNPYSFYSDKRWVFFNEKITISFKSLSGEFEKTIKDIAFKIIQSSMLMSKTSMLKNLIFGSVTFQNLILRQGGNSYKDLDNTIIYSAVIADARLLKLKYKTWKNSLIFFQL